MLFNSLEFFAFLPLALLGFAASPHRYRRVYLALISWYFYSFWDWRFLFLILLSTGVDYGVALGIQASKHSNRRRGLLAVSVIVNLCVLGFFKYWNFFCGSFVGVMNAMGVAVDPGMLKIVLPVGISFYTFQSMGYSIDVYRGRMRAQRSFFDVAAYVAFFPQLVAGPIERAENLLPQLQRSRGVAWRDWDVSTQLILWGLFKKLVIADNLAPFVGAVFGAQSALPEDAGLALLGVYAFAVQIYCDFSGYTDIARGVARLFGVKLMQNFNLPYLADSFRDFWRRWHISLSTWLRDYLYIPLGGSHGSNLRMAAALVITMLLGGLWHGASWLFVIWGLYHGVLLVIERGTQRLWRGGGIPAVWIRRVVVFHAVCIGWVFFRAETMDVLLRWWQTVLSFKMNPSYSGMWLRVVLYVSPLFFVWVLKARSAPVDFFAGRMRAWCHVLTVVLLYAGISVFGADAGREFIYFQF